MSDYISREAAQKAFENTDADVCESYPDGACDWGFGIKNIQEVIDGIPAADVEPVRHGEWLRTDDDWSSLVTIQCSACGGEWCFEFDEDVQLLGHNVGTSASLERGKITRVSEHTAEISGKRRAEYKIVRVNSVKPTMGNTWIPCSERLPEKAGFYLVVTPRGIEIMEFSSGDKRYRETPCFVSEALGKVSGYVTHWQPLPELPKG